MLTVYNVFSYSVNIRTDMEYGTEGRDGNWTGMVGEVVRGVSYC